jgi:hypothetical protein
MILSAKQGRGGANAEKDHFGWNFRGSSMQAKDVAAAQSLPEMWMIVGFEVMACSVKREYPAKIKPIDCLSV